MISFLRRLAGTWPARIFFAALAAAFVGWGISGKTNIGGGDPTRVATVDGRPITAGAFDQAFKDDMAQATQQYPDPTQVPPALRREVAAETLQRLVTEQALDAEATRMGVAAPPSAIQDGITSIAAFEGLDGKFDHNAYLRVLQQHNLTPQRFQDQMRLQVTKDQILKTVTASAHPSDLFTGLLFGYLFETRTADMVQIPFSAHAAPPAPPDATLQRYYDNNIARYTAPEYRRVKLVILSPDSIGRGLPVTDADLHAWYNANKATFEAPEKRSMQVITASSADTANLLATSWKAGATWDAIAANAKTRGATTTSLDNTTKEAIPAPELAAAAFAAPLNAITGPVTEPLGFQVVRVTSITPAKHPSFEDVRDTVRQRLGAERAMDLIDARSQKLQDLFAGGNRIDEVPADMGATGAEGTLDANGNTPEGTPAPIPATGNARTQIIADIFKAQKSDSVQLTEGPDHVWYAIAVQDIIKPTPRPFAEVRAKVLADWQAEQVRHAAETDAAKLLATINGGQSIANAAWGSGLQVTRTPPQLRNKPTPDVPADLVQLLFTMKKGEATMIETNKGFVVATLATITKPDPKSAPDQLEQVRQALTKSMSDDLLVSYGTAVRDNAKPVVNEKVFNRFAQPAEAE
jgi:peptidyl-prolyl cis-trans isomerase D